jgi:hypothetical protein
MPKKQRDNLEGSRRLESKIKRKYGKTNETGYLRSKYRQVVRRGWDIVFGPKCGPLF